MSQGNAEPAVKAYIGPLPAGEIGYSFETDVAPTRYRQFFGKPGAIWSEGGLGVQDVSTEKGTVFIPVKVL